MPFNPQHRETLGAMRPTKTLHVRLGEESYRVKYPFSPAMKHVLTEVFQGRDYPHCLPAGHNVETIVDVGANVGAAAIWFHHRYPESRIVSYEPSPHLFDLLRENTSVIDNVEARNVGLFDRDTTAQLHLGQHHDAQSSLVAHAETAGQSETITLRRASEELASLDVDRISILKLDTEGCEVPILNGLTDWLDRIDAIYLEYHSEADRREVDRLLSDHFYLIRAHVQRGNLGTLVYLAKNVAGDDRRYVCPAIPRPAD